MVNFNFENRRMELMKTFAILNKVKQSTNENKFGCLMNSVTQTYYSK